MMRHLASVRTVSSISPIPGADMIEVATVDGWKVVVKKGEFIAGDKAIYFEVDSFLPVEPEYEFLRKSSFRTHGISGNDGFRLRTMRLRGQISQGLLLPLRGEMSDVAVGADVTAMLGVTKWEVPIPTQIAGDIDGPFPSFIPKTDEERIQNLSADFDLFKRLRWVWTEKVDGSSITFYKDNGKFGVCSRNWSIKESDSHAGWNIAKEMNLPERLPDGYAIQGELLGPKVQGNRYKWKKAGILFFSAYDIRLGKYSLNALNSLIDELQISVVPQIGNGGLPCDSIDGLIKCADGKSLLADTDREGLVFRCYGESGELVKSFKVISNNFLLKDG